MLDQIYILNFKRFSEKTIPFNSKINIFIGDNETGKSTILESIYLALTKRLNGKLIDSELSPYLFNKETVKKYVESLSTENKEEPPSIVIEVWFSDATEGYESFKGNNNSQKKDAAGIKLVISFNEIYRGEYNSLLESGSIKTVPTDFYKIEWYGFDNNQFYPKQAPGVALIDTSKTMALMHT